MREQPRVGDFGFIGDTSVSPLVAQVDAALRAAIAKDDLDPDAGIYSVNGMSGKKYRYFINTLVGAVPNARYLEVGSWMGSTLCAAIHGNTVQAVAIDNWSEFGGPKDEFAYNVDRFATPGVQVAFIESDFRDVDYAALPGPFNIYLFDGPHKAIDQYQGLSLPLPCLADQFVFIVDDWNWQRVRDGTTAAISQCGLTILYAAAVRTTDDNNSPPHLWPLEDFRVVRDFDWHNGYFIAVLGKPASGHFIK